MSHPLVWTADILGPDFQATTIPLGPDPDGETDVEATLVRFEPARHQSAAVLYVHGMTDYFFHRHVATAFASQDLATYALDLRKCGRSRREGQSWHYSTDFTQYYDELTEALRILRAEGHDRVIVVAHSTGGLIVPVWLSDLHRAGAEEAGLVTGMLLNSPWLDMMFPRAIVATMTPASTLMSRIRPHTLAPGGNLGVYADALHRDYHGEWDFDLTFKPIAGHPKYFGWLRAVLDFQHRIHSGTVDAGVPALTICSQDSLLHQRAYSPAAHHADTVLDVRQIRQWHGLVSMDTELRAIKGAIHDVFLSREPVRREALDIASDWIVRRCLSPAADREERSGLR